MKPHAEHEYLNMQLDTYLPQWQAEIQATEPVRNQQTSEEKPGLPRTITSPLFENTEHDPLIAIAYHIRTAPELEFRPEFAQQLEQQLQAKNKVLINASHKQKKQFSQLIGKVLQWHQPKKRSIRFIIALSSAVCMICLSISTLIVAYQVTNPGNPLYSIKRWEQTLQLSLAGSTQNQARVHVQIAYDLLQTLSSTNGNDYNNTLTEFNKQVRTITNLTRSLPDGQEQKQITADLARLQTDARRTLHAQLPEQTLTEKAQTTQALASLGEVITQLSQAMITFTNQQHITVILNGKNFQPKAQLLINDQVFNTEGSLENDTYTFILLLKDTIEPHTIGLLNNDGTVVETQRIIKSSSSDNSSQSSQSTNSNNQNSSTTDNNKGNNNNKDGDNNNNGDNHKGNNGNNKNKNKDHKK